MLDKKNISFVSTNVANIFPWTLRCIICLWMNKSISCIAKLYLYSVDKTSAKHFVYRSTLWRQFVDEFRNKLIHGKLLLKLFCVLIILQLFHSNTDREILLNIAIGYSIYQYNRYVSRVYQEILLSSFCPLGYIVR